MKLKAIIANWKTSLLGLIPMIAGILTISGIITITPEQVQVVSDGVSSVADGANTLYDTVVGLIEIVLGIGLIFSRDADVSSEASIDKSSI